MMTFTLVISCLTTSNLPWFTDLLPGSCAILLFTASDLASITSHIHNWVLFLLWLHPLILSGVISPLISSSIFAPTDLGTFSFSIQHFAFSYCSWSSPGKNTVVVCHSFLKWTTFCQTSPPWTSVLGGLTWHGLVSLSYTRLWSVWSDWLVSCDYGFSVSALWCPLATPTILLGFLLPWTWDISSRLLQQSAAAASYLGRVVSPHGCLPLLTLNVV